MASSSGRDHLRVAQHLSNAIAAALDDICQDMARYQARQEQRLQLGRCIAAADELVEQLEGLSLAGAAEVPGDWQPRLDRFVEGLPAAVAGDLHSGGDPNRLLDQVFAIEERLFRLKLGEWAQRFDPDEVYGLEPEPGDPAPDRLR